MKVLSFLSVYRVHLLSLLLSLSSFLYTFLTWLQLMKNLSRSQFFFRSIIWVLKRHTFEEIVVFLLQNWNICDRRATPALVQLRVAFTCLVFSISVSDLNLFHILFGENVHLASWEKKLQLWETQNKSMVWFSIWL